MSSTNAGRNMKNSVVSAFIIMIGFELALCLEKKSMDAEKVTDCMYMASDDGYLEVESHQVGADTTCGIYVIKSPDEVVEIEIDRMAVSCDAGGLINLIDGWEMNGQFFPSETDHPLPMRQRFKEVCGASRGDSEPAAALLTSQNAALVSYRMPARGDRFRVKIKGIKNPSPCNVLLDSGEGIFMLQNNNGERSNCSVTSIFPADVQVLETEFVAKSGHMSAFPAAAAGVPASRSSLVSMLTSQRRVARAHRAAGAAHAGFEKDCLGSGDYLDIRGGSGLDSDAMQSFKTFCSRDSVSGRAGGGKSDAYEASVLCGSTTVRLASSGKSFNTVKFAVKAIPLDNPEHLPVFKGEQFFCPMDI